MASRRELKKNVNYIAGELFTECLINSMFIPGTDKVKADKLMAEVLKMQDEFVTRISHTEPGNVKGFYKKFRADFNAKVNEIIEAIGRKTSFMMKKEWFFFPLGFFFKAVGGIPVDRSRKTSLVDQMVHKFAEYKKFNLAITPEGTRKANPNWKKGFYFIALKAQVPIVLIGIDYSKKTISATKAIMPSGDINKDMREIKLYFKDFKGKHPENFALGEI